MADISDVLSALQTLIVAAIYPNGTDQPSVVVGAVPVRVYQGWPNPQQLDADLKLPVCHVSIYPRPDERNTTRYPKDWQPQSVNAPTLTLTANGQQITIGGTVSIPQNAVAFVNGKPYVYALQGGDTLTSIATALATLIAAAVPSTTSTGPVITLPATARIGALRIGVGGTSIMEVRRQQRTIQITVWADSPTNRDAVMKVIDPMLAATERLTLADTTSARLIYKSSPVTDQFQKEKLYRRDLMYSVEYATTITEADTTITVEQINETPWIDGATQGSPGTTTYL